MKGETRNHPNAAPEGHIAAYDIPDLKQSQPIENAAVGCGVSQCGISAIRNSSTA
jgi:hypothetical protein